MSGPAKGTATSVAADANPDDYRLPTNVSPKHYDLVFKTDLHSSTPHFSGEALITLDVNSDTSKLVFNIHPSLKVSSLAIASSELKTTSSVTLPISAMSVLEEEERGLVDLKSLPGGGLKAGTKGVKVWFRFEAELSGNMMGYYKSEGDREVEGKKPLYALTQFEATAARRAFPCWDEPLLKSTYAVSMIAGEKETVLSNMPEVSSKPWKAPSHVSEDSVFNDGYELGSMLGQPLSLGKTQGGEPSGEWKITKFETSPLMSTYLVAFACGEFAYLNSEYQSAKTGKVVPLRIFSTPDTIKQARFGLDIKKWALPIYEEIFDIPFALPKLDTLVAHDFDQGAMENWGLITGRTTAYLYDPEKSSLAAKKRVADVQCHELAHMWFGNIVTMKWWDNLWLNEAFATFMGEVVISDRIWPEWKVRSQFIDYHLQTRALVLDAQRSSHAIEVECPDANQINQIFDGISYSKGASVLRMLAGMVGEVTFLKGVSIYLKKHLYGNAETRDLWDGMTEASGLDIAKIMSNWILKMGFPIINVEETGDGKIKITQNRFLSTGDVKPEEDETLWYVPLEIKTIKNGKASVDHTAILQGRSMTYDLGGADSFKLNAETVGVYRVGYSPQRFAKLGKEASNFSIEDRVGLLADAATLAQAGYGKTSGSLALVHDLGRVETEYLPWSQITAALGKIVATWWEQAEPVREALDKLRIALCRPVVDKLGYDHRPSDEDDVKELRELVIRTCTAARDAGVLAELHRRFEPFLANNDDSRIPPDLQRTIYSAAVRHGGIKEYEKIRKLYDNPPNPSTKVDTIYALCSTENDEMLDRTYKMMVDGSVKSQDLYYFFAVLGQNRKTRRRTAEVLKKDYDGLYKQFGDNATMSSIVKFAFATLTSYEDLEMVKDFFKDKDIRKFHRGVSQTYDTIQAAAEWLSRDQKDVEEWLKKNNYL